VDDQVAFPENDVTVSIPLAAQTRKRYNKTGINIPHDESGREMIWNAIKFITLSEIIGWAVFLVVALVLGAFGVQAKGTAGQAVMYALWIVLFFGAYQFLNRRRRARRP